MSKPAHLEPTAKAGTRSDAAPAAADNEAPIKASYASAPEPFDQAKVDAIKSAIVEGRLAVDYDKIADQLIDNSLDLLG